MNVKYKAISVSGNIEKQVEADAKNKLEDQFVYIKQAPEKQKLKIISNAMLLCYPQITHWVGGLSPLEAMALRTPVVCFDFPVLRELYGDCAIYAKPKDVDSLQDKILSVLNDDFDGMQRVIDGSLIHAARLLKKDFSAACYCAMGGGVEGSPDFTWISNRMNENGMTFFHLVIWDKKNPGTGWRYRRQHELVIVGMREGSKIAWPGGGSTSNPGSIANIISISKPRRYGETHPNDKPPELVQKFLSVHTAPGDVVLDPFMGGGATGIACLRMGQKFIGIELDPKYFELACTNIEKAQRQGALPLPDVKPVQEGFGL